MSEQLQLPYALIEKVANRVFIRETFTRTSEDCHFIPLSEIEERPGFIERVVYEGIEELADDIYYQGQKEAMVLDILPTGKGIIDEGSRRLRAFKRNLELGRIKEDHPVKFKYNSSKITEFDRMARQITSNGNFKKEYKPYETAKVIWNLKHLYSEVPLTNEEIAKSLNYRISRQHIDNYIKIANADDRLRQEMITADMNITECLALIKHKKKGDEVTDKKEMQSHITEVTIPVQKDELAGDIAELKELQKETPEEAEIREEKEMAALLEIADEVKTSKLKQHLGKKIAAPIRQTEPQEFVDTENSGEVVTVEKTTLFLNTGTILTEDIIEDIQNKGVKTVFLFKPGCEPVAPSVVTVPPEKKEKEKFDTKIPGIKSCNKAIQSVDKIEAIVNKLDVPEDVKKDLAYWVHWAAQNIQEARQWIHDNPPK